MKRSLVLPTIALAALTGLAACGVGAGSSQSAPSGNELSPSASVSGEITFWHAYSAGGGEINALEKTIIPNFEKLHPGVKVHDVQVPSSDMHQKLITATAGGALPDVVRADIVTVPELAKLGVLAPLSDVMPDFQSWAAKMFPGPLATNKYKDKYWGLPLDTNTRVVIYNQDALTSQGVSQVPKSLDDLKAAASKVGGGKFIFAEGGSGAWNLLPFIWSNGGEMTDPSVSKATGYLNSPQTVDAIQMLVDMYRAKQIPGNILGGSGDTPTSDGLAKGLYDTIVDGPWTFPGLTASYPSFKPATEPMFSGSAGSISVVGGEDIVMTQQSKNKALAAEFVRYMLSPDAQQAMGKVGQLSAEPALAADMASYAPYYAPYLEQLKTARPRPATPQWAKVDDIFTKQVQLAFQGKVTVQQALDSAASQIDPLLAQG
ncbi:extracellular solute-binding protein [Sinomonas sp. ASV322]|uniref:extracellular solute-binding protein n=1 Tax=Sinomonas sp. ASV322 TaxID=3041920 RepID=UPI0027DB992C|nr:extracellular solute-binding protein [Sinomonas sp. ASV322]MDQ4503454.1 extracellular solute-binding protein [Sinomonas sp. ASV322]